MSTRTLARSVCDSIDRTTPGGMPYRPRRWPEALAWALVGVAMLAVIGAMA